MKRLVAGFLLLAICSLAAADDAKNTKVTKLDGTKLFGKVEVVDNYTIRISSDSGILKIPIALLEAADFKKFLGAQDRSNDGRLWSERKDALEAEKSKESSKPKSGDSGGDAIEIQLQELVPFLPVIASYQEKLSLEKAKGDDQDATKKDATSTESAPAMSLFSSGGFGSPASALSNIPGVSAAASAASSVLKAAPVPEAPVP